MPSAPGLIRRAFVTTLDAKILHPDGVICDWIVSWYSPRHPLHPHSRWIGCRRRPMSYRTSFSNSDVCSAAKTGFSFLLNFFPHVVETGSLLFTRFGPISDQMLFDLTIARDVWFEIEQIQFWKNVEQRCFAILVCDVGSVGPEPTWCAAEVSQCLTICNIFDWPPVAGSIFGPLCRTFFSPTSFHHEISSSAYLISNQHYFVSVEWIY